MRWPTTGPEQLPGRLLPILYDSTLNIATCRIFCQFLQVDFCVSAPHVHVVYMHMPLTLCHRLCAPKSRDPRIPVLVVLAPGPSSSSAARTIQGVWGRTMCGRNCRLRCWMGNGSQGPGLPQSSLETFAFRTYGAFILRVIDH